MEINENAAKNLETLREKQPLIHHITNWVTISECASITRSLGSLPVMAHSVEEVEEMVKISGALVLNIGTLTPELINSMIVAGKRANENNVPVILDAVGAGATTLRTLSTRKLLDSVKISIIKGNAGEIATIAGAEAEVKGVESISVEGDIVSLAKELANNLKTTIVVTAPEDIVTNGITTYIIKNGHKKMGEVVGTGCMSASVMASFAAVDNDMARAAAGALAAYGIAGEDAAGISKGPGTMKTNLFDAIYNMTVQDVKQRANIHVQ